MGVQTMNTQKGIEAIRLGDTQRGQTLLRQAVVQNPQDEQAWLWLSTVVNSTDQQLDCLRHVLEINPFNHAARRDLAALPARFHYDAQAPLSTPAANSAPGGAGVAAAPARSAPRPSSQIQITPIPAPAASTAASTVASQNLRNQTTVASAQPAPAAPKTYGGTQTIGSLYGINSTTPPISAVLVPDPVVATLVDDLPRDPDYSPVQAVAARKFAHGVVRKSAGTRTNLHLARIGLGVAVFALTALLALALLVDMSQRAEREQQAAGGRLGSTANTSKTVTTVNPASRTFGTVTTTIQGAHGALTVPGTAFVDGRVLTANPPWTMDVIWVWDEPFETSRLQCKLPHGTSVLLLETKTAPDGKKAVRIQNRDCEGWVSSDLLNPVAAPAVGPIKDNENWRFGK